MIQRSHSRRMTTDDENHIQILRNTSVQRKLSSKWAKLQAIITSSNLKVYVIIMCRNPTISVLLLFCFQNKSKLVTYVVASGLTYGCGENIFHYLFKVRLLYFYTYYSHLHVIYHIYY